MIIIIGLFAFAFIATSLLPRLWSKYLDQQWLKIVILLPIGFCLLWFWFKAEYTIIKINIHIIREARSPFMLYVL